MTQKIVAVGSTHRVNGSGNVLDKRREARREKEVIALSVVVANGHQPAGALSESEQAGFAECEGILKRGLCIFYEVGFALLKIQEERLYRATHVTFEAYCRERWNMGRSYASRVIGGAERVKLLPADESMPKPANEFQMRPFLKLEPEAFPAAWKRVVKNAKGGKITTRIVRAVIRDLLPGHAEGKKKKRRKGKVPVGQFLALLNEAKRQVEKGESAKALSALERMENLLVMA